jgi:predicted short-subunit dehydrogenase-like oxidoreductase (DUF2520 family)
MVDRRLKLSTVVSRSASKARRLGRQYHVQGRSIDELESLSGLVILCVPDDVVTTLAQRLSASIHQWRGCIVLHTSGALAADALEPLRSRGAAVGSLHPLMTFPPEASIEPNGLLFAIEGDRRAVEVSRQLVSRLKGEPVELRASEKPGYHLAATLACAMVAIALAAAEDALAATTISAVRRHEIRRGLIRLAAQTVANAQLDTANAWTGPIARADTTTVAEHLRQLSRSDELRDYYRAAARLAVSLLPVQHPDRLLDSLAG